MAPSIQVFLQVSLLCCVVTASMGGITDWQKAFSQLEKKVKVSQEEIDSLHQKIEQLEKRLEPLEVKGEIGEVQIQSTVPILYARNQASPQSYLLTIEVTSTCHCMMSPMTFIGKKHLRE